MGCAQLPVKARIKDRIGDLLLIETERGQISVVPAVSLCDFLSKVNIVLEDPLVEKCSGRRASKRRK